MRSLLVVVFIIFLTSCSSKLAYNNLDWWVYWYMDDYIELKDEQEEKFDAHLQNWLSWHKKSELTRYKAQLEDIKKQIQNETLNSSIVYNNLELARSHWERVRDEVSPELAAIAKTLDDEQVVTLFAALEKDNKEEEEERQEALEKSEAERLKDRIERIQETISERIGDLSKEQKQIVSTYAQQFISTGDAWITYCRNIQNAARKLFVSRKQNERFEQELVALMQNPDNYKSDVYKQSSAHNMIVTATLLAEIFSTLSEKQRQTLIENVDELIETVDNFMD
jgi:rubrerythrin